MSIRTRKRGKTYSYIFEAGKTASGKRKVVERGGFATAKDAYRAGVDAYADYTKFVCSQHRQPAARNSKNLWQND